MSPVVAKESDIPPGTMKVVRIGELRIAVCNVEGKFYALEDVCTHDDGPLGEGSLKGGELECHRHGARFCVKTGAARRMPAVVGVRTFPVKVSGGSVEVEA